MEISKQMDATIHEVYEVILESLYQEVFQSSNKKVHKSALKKGFHYTKRVKKGKKTAEYRYFFKEFDESVGYKLEIKTNTGTIYMEMDWQASEDGCLVTYREDFKPDQELKGIMVRISYFFYQKKIKRRAKRMLNDIERFIKKQRTSEEQGE